MNRTFLIRTALCGLFAGPLATARAAYVYQTIDFPGAVATFANGISVDGRIVGEYEDANLVTHAFTLVDGDYEELVVPGAASYASANGVNSAGDVVGIYTAANNVTYGYVRNADGFVDLTGQRTSPYTQALSINEAGHVVGSYVDSAGRMRGFRYENNSMQSLSFGGAETIAIGINNTGSVVGAYLSNGVPRGFQLSDGDFTPISFPTSLQNEAQGINDSGQIGGLYLSREYRFHGFVGDDDVYDVVHMPNSLETKVFGINNAGQVVGAYLDSQGRSRGFTAMPLPHRAASGVELTDLPGVVVTANAHTVGGEPENAVDNMDYVGGSYSWVAGGHGTIDFPNWLQLDFGAEFSISGIEVRGVFNDPALGYEGYDNVFNLQASRDGQEWSAIGSGVSLDIGDINLRDELFHFAGPAQPLARYLRYQVVGGSHWSTIGEINVQGSLPGDANGDLTVDLVDLNLVRNNFGLSGDGVLGDTDGDQVVDLVDLNNVRNHFGAAAGTITVPEPSASVLLCVAAMAMVYVRRFGRKP